MKLTDRTRTLLAARRARRALLGDGWEEVGEGGGRLWELYRGSRVGHAITEVRIGPEGTSLFIKTAARPQP